MDYEELWEEQKLKKEQQQERLDKEYFNSMMERRRFNQKQMAQASVTYEAGTIVSDDFYSEIPEQIYNV